MAYRCAQVLMLNPCHTHERPGVQQHLYHLKVRIKNISSSSLDVKGASLFFLREPKEVQYPECCLAVAEFYSMAE